MGRILIGNVRGKQGIPGQDGKQGIQGIQGVQGIPGPGGWALGYTPQGYDWEFTNTYYLNKEVWAIRLNDYVPVDLHSLGESGSGSIWNYSKTLVSVEFGDWTSDHDKFWAQSDLKLFLPDSYYTLYSGSSFFGATKQMINLQIGHNSAYIGQVTMMDVNLSIVAPTQYFAGFLQINMSMLNPILNNENFEQKYFNIEIDGVLYALRQS
jgi:hypothetical protein